MIVRYMLSCVYPSAIKYFLLFFCSFTLASVRRRRRRSRQSDPGNLWLRYSVSIMTCVTHFQPNSGGIAYILAPVAQRRTLPRYQS